MIVRRLPFAVAALALVGATACEKPAPQVTFFSSGRVFNVDATRYCFDKCLDHKDAEAKRIRVRGNTIVAIDLPKRVAEKGWILLINNEPQWQKPLTDSHFSLNIPALPQNTADGAAEQAVPVSVVETESGNLANPTGRWELQFVLKP